MKKTTLFKLFSLLLLSLSVTLILASCDVGALFDDGEEESYEDYYTVTFDSDGGTEIDPVTVERGALVPEPANPIKPGFLFRGWYNGSVKWNFENQFYEVNKNITLVARWEESNVKYTVTLDTAGGELEETVLTVLDGAPVTIPVKPKKDGYRLEGWYNGEERWNFDTLVTSDMTLVANWVLKSDYLVYDVETTPLHLVYSTSGISKERDNAIYELFTHLSNIIDTEPTLAKDGDRVPIDNEIVVGRTIRIISGKAYGILDSLPRAEGEKCFLFYVERSRWEQLDVNGEVVHDSVPILSENGYSVAIAYDSSEGDAVAVRAINYFIENFAKEEFAHTPGVVCVGRISADGTLAVTNSVTPDAVPDAQDDPTSLGQDFESAQNGVYLPEGIQGEIPNGYIVDPMSSLTVEQKRDGSNKYLKIVTWDTYVDPEVGSWNGWDTARLGYANRDVIFTPSDASETEGYFVVSFDINARYFTSMSYGAGADKRGILLSFCDTEGNEKAQLMFAVTESGYVITAGSGYPAAVSRRETVNLRFVYCIEDGKVYCYLDNVVFAWFDYGAAGETADLGSLRFDFMNSLISNIEIDNIIVANNVVPKE